MCCQLTFLENPSPGHTAVTMMVATEAAAGLKLYCRGGEGCCGREDERLCGAGEGDCDHDDQVAHGCRAGNEPSRSLKFIIHGDGA